MKRATAKRILRECVVVSVLDATVAPPQSLRLLDGPYPQRLLYKAARRLRRLRSQE